MNVAEFLLARIAEDAGAARRVPPFSHRDVVTALPFGPTRVHIGIHDPARVLAECEAKRRIVEQYADYLSTVRAYRSPRWSDAMNEQDKENARQAEARHRVAEDVAQLLALPYANHPDYDPSWRP